jgi:arylsulfatase G
MTYLYLVLAFALAVSAAPNSEPRTPLRPNFVVIFLDDAGWGDVGFNVGDEITPETKVLDKLAREGLRFTDFHAAASVCTPSRASLLTGRLGLRTGVIKNFREGALGGLPTTEMTIAELLRDHAGYQTAMLGKWHLGTHPPYHPTYRGFNRYFGVPYSVDMGCTDIGIDHPPHLPCCRSGSKGSSGRQSLHHPHRRLMTIPDTVDQVVMSGAHFFDPSSVVGTRGPTCEEAPGVPLYNSTGAHCSGEPSCNNDILEQPVNLTSLSRRYGDFAVNFLEEMAREQTGNNTSERPFFLYIAMSHMHVPLAYDARFEEASPRTDRKIYGNALAEGEKANILYFEDKNFRYGWRQESAKLFRMN